MNGNSVKNGHKAIGIAAGRASDKAIATRVIALDMGKDLLVGQAVGRPSVARSKIKAAVKAVVKDMEMI